MIMTKSLNSNDDLSHKVYYDLTVSVEDGSGNALEDVIVTGMCPGEDVDTTTAADGTASADECAFQVGQSFGLSVRKDGYICDPPTINEMVTYSLEGSVFQSVCREVRSGTHVLGSSR